MSTVDLDRPATAAHIHVSPVSLPRVLHAEWVKMRSLRSTTLTLAAAVASLVGIGWIVGYVSNLNWDTASAADLASFDAINTSLTGYELAQLAVGVLGVLLVTGEYATGMIRSSFAAVPARLPVLWAKALLYAAVTFPLMLAAAFAAFLGGQQFLGSHGTTLSADHALQSVVGVAGFLTLLGVLAVALGFIIRSTAGGVATLFGLLLVLPALGLVLPASWQHHVLPYLPSNAGASMFKLKLDASDLSAGTGLLVLCLWVAAALAAAAVTVRRRDA